MIGFGYDIHRLAPGESLIIGGVHFPDSPVGTVAHSDGDVLVHAIIDALLGAKALGDIGAHFPDTDPQHKNASSIELLRKVAKMIEGTGARIVNIDSTVVLERPKLLASIGAMRKNVAEALGLDITKISVKATTSERIGFVGREEGIAAYAVCQLQSE
ncbi:MAG: 2-C-methyl-D-erythritol 2,4-cyclodiphosphate synthase [Bacteroidota bacterium]|nr:2-C-methyl-D-erythritol 2,4-cyclodiphosphate synthase [Bacteroidota bacterium]MDP4229221.1 2-C-methyl-D-erythritol 2,4-cyclodiphosphate synthase [Bacteroidota bacterium]MDP4236060.1 2-C-methyl-D-erythritol 2,4-cyclodiphosphate synthase [Bacteroidota bacterium]